MRIVGLEQKTFSFDDGKTVSGLYIYLTDKADNVEGLRTERIFISNAKLQGYSPALGDNINVFYNRFGKVQCIVLADSLVTQ